MKKTIKSAICLFLCVILLSSFAVLGFTDSTRITTCGDDCEFYPTIIVPGLGQSSVIVTDDNGNPLLDKDGKKISAFPAWIQTDKIVAKAVMPALASLALQRDAGLSDAFADIIDLVFGINACDLNAQVVTNTATEKFPYPYSKYSEYEVGIVNMHIPFEKYPIYSCFPFFQI